MSTPIIFPSNVSALSQQQLTNLLGSTGQITGSTINANGSMTILGVTAAGQPLVATLTSSGVGPFVATSASYGFADGTLVGVATQTFLPNGGVTLAVNSGNASVDGKFANLTFASQDALNAYMTASGININVSNFGAVAVIGTQSGSDVPQLLADTVQFAPNNAVSVSYLTNGQAVIQTADGQVLTSDITGFVALTQPITVTTTGDNGALVNFTIAPTGSDNGSVKWTMTVNLSSGEVLKFAGTIGEDGTPTSLTINGNPVVNVAAVTQYGLTAGGLLDLYAGSNAAGLGKLVDSLSLPGPNGTVPTISDLAFGANGELTFNSTEPVGLAQSSPANTTVSILPNQQGVTANPNDGTDSVSYPPAGNLTFIMPNLGQPTTIPQPPDEHSSSPSAVIEGASAASHVATSVLALDAGVAGNEALKSVLDFGVGPLFSALLAFQSAKLEGLSDQEAGEIAAATAIGQAGGTALGTRLGATLLGQPELGGTLVGLFGAILAGSLAQSLIAGPPVTYLGNGQFVMTVVAGEGSAIVPIDASSLPHTAGGWIVTSNGLVSPDGQLQLKSDGTLLNGQNQPLGKITLGQDPETKSATLTLQPFDPSTGAPNGPPQTQTLSVDSNGKITITLVPGNGQTGAETTIVPDNGGAGINGPGQVTVTQPNPNAPSGNVTEEIAVNSDGTKTVTAFATDAQGNEVGPLLNVAIGTNGAIAGIDGLTISAPDRGVIGDSGLSQLLDGNVTVSGGQPGQFTLPSASGEEHSEASPGLNSIQLTENSAGNVVGVTLAGLNNIGDNATVSLVSNNGTLAVNQTTTTFLAANNTTINETDNYAAGIETSKTITAEGQTGAPQWTLTELANGSATLSSALQTTIDFASGTLIGFSLSQTGQIVADLVAGADGLARSLIFDPLNEITAIDVGANQVAEVGSGSTIAVNSDLISATAGALVNGDFAQTLTIGAGTVTQTDKSADIGNPLDLLFQADMASAPPILQQALVDGLTYDGSTSVPSFLDAATNSFIAGALSVAQNDEQAAVVADQAAVDGGITQALPVDLLPALTPLVTESLQDDGFSFQEELYATTGVNVDIHSPLPAPPANFSPPVSFSPPPLLPPFFSPPPFVPPGFSPPPFEPPPFSPPPFILPTFSPPPFEPPLFEPPPFLPPPFFSPPPFEPPLFVPPPYFSPPPFFISDDPLLISEDPLVVSTNGTGINLVPLGASRTRFDFSDDGTPQATGWIGPNTGFLVLNPDNGVIDKGSELLRVAQLATLDSNHDGVINAADPAFSHLKVWIDGNGDGVSEPGEIVPLAALGIQSINAAATPVNENVAGSMVTAVGSLTFTDGRTEAVDDVTFAAAPSPAQVHLNGASAAALSFLREVLPTPAVAVRDAATGDATAIAGELSLIEGADAVMRNEEFARTTLLSPFSLPPDSIYMFKPSPPVPFIAIPAPADARQAEAVVAPALEATQSAAQAVATAAADQTPSELAAATGNVESTTDAAWQSAFTALLAAEAAIPGATAAVAAAQPNVAAALVLPAGYQYLNFSDPQAAADAAAEQSASTQALASNQLVLQSLTAAIAQAWRANQVMIATGDQAVTATGGDLVVAASGLQSATDGASPNAYVILPGANISIANFLTGASGSRIYFLDSGGTPSVSAVAGGTQVSLSSSTVTLSGVTPAQLSLGQNFSGNGLEETIPTLPAEVAGSAAADAAAIPDLQSRISLADEQLAFDDTAFTQAFPTIPAYLFDDVLIIGGPNNGAVTAPHDVRQAESILMQALDATSGAAQAVAVAANRETSSELAAAIADIENAVVGSTADSAAADSASTTEAAWQTAFTALVAANAAIPGAAAAVANAQNSVAAALLVPGEEYATSWDPRKAADASAEERALARALAIDEVTLQSLTAAVAPAFGTTAVMIAANGQPATATGGDLVVAAAGSESAIDGASASTYVVLPGATISISNFLAGPNGSRLYFLDGGGTATISAVGGGTQINVGSSTVILWGVTPAELSPRDNFAGINALQAAAGTPNWSLAPAGGAFVDGTTHVQTLSVSGSGNTLSGGSTADTIVVTGAGSNNLLRGGSGNETLIAGGTGAQQVNDTLFAGSGNDVLTLTGNSSTLAAGSGTDVLTVFGTGNTLFAENGVATLEATGAGNTLLGGSGATTLTSDLGGNTLIAGTGATVAAYSASGMTANLQAATATSNGASSHDTLIGITDLTVSGNANTLIGGAGHETLDAVGSGNTLIGGSGPTTLSSNLGGNTLVGGSGATEASYDGNAFTVNLQTGTAEANGTSVSDILTGIRYVSVVGNDDTLIGGSSASTLQVAGTGNTLIGGSGATTLASDTSGNTLIAGTGSTTVSYAVIGMTVNLATGTAILNGSGAGDSLIGITDVTLFGAFDTLVAGPAGSTLTAFGDGDTLLGHGGDSLVIGWGGNSGTLITAGSGDTLIAGFGADTLSAGGGQDTLVGNAAGSTLNASAGTAATAVYGLDNVTVNLAAGTASVNGSSAADTLIGLTAVTVTGNNDTLVGNNSGDTLSAAGSSDIVRGGTGNDTLIIVNGGTDTLFGGAGNNTFVVLSAHVTPGLNQPQNLIADFNPANPGETIDLTHISGVSTFANLSFSTVTFGGQSYLQVSLGNTGQAITLAGVTAGQLSAGNFMFAAATLGNAPASASFTEEAAATTLAPSATVCDPVSGTLASATVKITGGTFAGDGDVLAASTAGTGIAASYNASTEILTLSGSDTLAHYQQVLEKVTFAAGENPTNYGANPTRTIVWTLNDGGAASAPVTTTVSITNVDDPPTLVAGTAAASYTEEGAAATLSPSAAVSDPDNLSLASATVKIVGGTFAGDGDVLAAATAGTNVGASYSATTETLTLSGNDTLAHYSQVLDKVTFAAGENPTNYGSNPTRTIVWTVNDGSAASAAVTTTVNITNTNDPPTLSNVAASLTFITGQTVVISPTLSISDPDSLTLGGATVSVVGGTFAGAGDVLAASVAGTAINASYNPTTETLVLSGSDTLAHYRQVLESVTFAGGADPANGGLNQTRTLSWTLNDGSASNNLSSAVFSTISIPFAVRNDFNGDGKSDLLWQNSDGQVGIWELNGASILSAAPVRNPGPAWHVVASGDFNQDLKADIVLQNTDGMPAIWEMNGTSVISAGALSSNPGSSWHVIATADFNGDGNTDILWQNTDGMPAIWEMNGTSVIAAGAVGTNPGSGWRVVGAGDFNGDGKADILWQNTDGMPGIWEMNGMSPIAEVGLSNPGSNWRVIGAGDVNNDGHADILWEATDDTPGIWEMNGTTPIAEVGLPNPGAGWQMIGASDVNGDGNADLLWQSAGGQPGIWEMNGTSILGEFGLTNPGSTWKLEDDGPIPVDQMDGAPTSFAGQPPVDPGAALVNAASIQSGQGGTGAAVWVSRDPVSPVTGNGAIGINGSAFDIGGLGANGIGRPAGTTLPLSGFVPSGLSLAGTSTNPNQHHVLGGV